MVKVRKKRRGAARGLLRRVKGRKGMTDEESRQSAIEKRRKHADLVAELLAELGGSEPQLEQIPRRRSGPIDPEQVFESLRRDQASGELARWLTEGRMYYEGSRSHPGCIDRVQPDGTRETGRWIDGRFVPLK